MGASGSKGTVEWRSFWTVPLAGALGYSLAVLHVYSIGAFIGPLQQAFDWSRAEASMGITIVGVVSGFFGVPIGMLVDRLGPRLVGLIGVFTMTGSVALLGTATGSTANWVLLWSVVSFGALWVHSTIWTSAVASRFEASRGLAFAVTLSGASVGATVFPVLATWLIGSHGWRTAYVAMSGIWFALVLPMLFLFFRGAQDKKRTERAAVLAAASLLPGLSLSDGLRSPAFYKLLIAGGLFAFTAIGIVVHFVPILTDSGAEPLAAAGVAALIGIFSIIGRLCTGLLLDRFPARLIGAGAFLLPIISCALLLFDGANPVSQAVAAAILGLTVGAEIDVIAYLATRHFGLKNFGGLFGGLVAALSLGTAFGPLAAGATFDRFDTYAPFLVLTTIFMAASSLALASLHHPPFAAGDHAQTP